MTTELTLIRHGQAHCTVQGIVGGRRGCTGLTAVGRRQADLVGDRLAREHAERKFAVLCTTPLRRAREAAAIVAKRLNIPVQVVPDLREPDYGEADGKLWRDVMATVTATADEGLYRPIAAGAEPWTAYAARTKAALCTLVSEHRGQRILVVGHGETITTSAHFFLDLPVSMRVTAGFDTTEGAITRWTLQPLEPSRDGTEPRWMWHLTTHNDTRHLQ
ncbi:histidine phosphatase family protein [Amycolatopsis anabasis]|uniref:histidine phosphatase family protein n=1 Tax=Amycolatopsis anabasis TaxID=1840409 RepID=UPI00131AF8B9|nr:histidine phosphatase family protein [Amycolatopsis anabasis]